jgi:hypothetical protein
VLVIHFDRKPLFNLTGRACRHRQMLDQDGHRASQQRPSNIVLWPPSWASGSAPKSQTFRALTTCATTPVGGR